MEGEVLQNRRPQVHPKFLPVPLSSAADERRGSLEG